MCTKVRCRKCGKATWSGCGKHVDIVLAGVPKAQRCSCGKGGTKSTNKPTEETSEKKGFFSKIFGK